MLMFTLSMSSCKEDAAEARLKVEVAAANKDLPTSGGMGMTVEKITLDDNAKVAKFNYSVANAEMVEAIKQNLEGVHENMRREFKNDEMIQLLAEANYGVEFIYSSGSASAKVTISAAEVKELAGK